MRIYLWFGYFVQDNANCSSLKENTPLSQPIALGESDSLKLILTTQEARSAKRPHQAFLLLKDSQNGLDISYPLSVKDSGKSKLELVSAHAQEIVLWFACSYYLRF